MSLDDFIDAEKESEEKFTIIEFPSSEELKHVLNNKTKRHVIMIFANCNIDNKGRAKSTLSDGDKIILIKPDGTLLVHENKKREPVNWQPPGSKVNALTKNDKLIILSKRDKPREELKIQINHVYFIATMKVQQGRFKLLGSEKDMVDYVQSNPDILEEGLKVVKREAPTPYGFIDLIALDREGNTVIMEFKRRTATVSTVLQLSRYIKYYSKYNKEKLRGVIVAPKITDEALLLLKNMGFEFKKLDPSKLHTTKQ